MPEVHFIGFEKKTKQTMARVRKQLLKLLKEEEGRGPETIEAIRNQCVFVGHPASVVFGLKDGKRSPYILVQSTDRDESEMLSIVLMSLNPRIDIVEGAVLEGFTDAKTGSDDDEDDF